MKPIITLKNITKRFTLGPREEIVAVSSVDLEIGQGEFFVLLGPSGSGKSTLLRIMSGLEKSFEGRLILGEGITKNNFSFVFQQFALLPWLTVLENVALGLVARRTAPFEKQERVMEELHRFGLEKFAHARPLELSGGMRQRVGLARALATDPKVIFMDEPFSELDSFTAEELRKEILIIYKERRPTIVMVTHIIPDAIELADRVAVLTDRPGKIEKVVPISLSRPRNLRSEASFKLEDELYRLVRP